MSDNCEICTCRGDIKKCNELPDEDCSMKESWAFRYHRRRALLFPEMAAKIRLDARHDNTLADLLARIEAEEKGD